MAASRLPLLDAMKGLGCMAIVLHHLAFYGPMSDVVHKAAPDTINFLYNYARLAVQMFFVLGGYLVAPQFSRANRDVRYGDFMRVMNTLQGNGYFQVALINEEL